MTGALHPSASATVGSTAPPLSGYLVAATDRHISVRVADGTWTFRRADVLSLTDWESAAAQGICEERPVLVRVRSGTVADFTQRRRVELVDRPLTLPQDHTPARGDDELQRLTEIWARTLELTTRPGVGGATMTCCQTRSHNGSDDGAACDSLD
ncbi:hypothetical protein [Nocardia huaxiensis]|uniref:Uncharacterized protein n=1 Tax=Nocardia huaxiensis TaxID=2755382 RepID=A0A7D6ZU24_9NOCA|nr:hypothetical protein [Nocardia huaxiensis]QLY28689.1 hypothetical protein H0264_25565 [Nocardia huaxiensis]UFS97837.1 hypothetical protein LPY97_08030 [Nocardia huaxiensis]